MALISGSFVAVGDSITQGVGASVDWPGLVSSDLGVTGHNLGLSGAGWTFGANLTSTNTLTDLAPTQVDAPYVGATPQPFLCLFAGSNDLYGGLSAAGTIAAFQNYVQLRINAGWRSSRIIVCTMLGRQFVPEVDRAAYNAGMVSSQATYSYNLARLDLDANIGGALAYQNTTYFQGDQTHPTDAGQTIIAGIFEAVQLFQSAVAPLRLRLHA